MFEKLLTFLSERFMKDLKKMSFGTKLTTSELKEIIGGAGQTPIGAGCRCTCDHAAGEWIQYYMECRNGSVVIESPVCENWDGFRPTATCVFPI